MCAQHFSRRLSQQVTSSVRSQPSSSGGFVAFLHLRGFLPSHISILNLDLAQSFLYV